MRQHITIIRCPHCNKISEFVFTRFRTLRGTPVRYCRHCDRTFFEPSFTEDALLMYQNIRDPQPVRSVLLTAFFGVMTYAALRNCTETGYTGTPLVALIFVGALFLLFFAGFLADLHHSADKEEYKRERTRRTEEYLASQRAPVKLQESMKRLSDPDYVRILLKNNVDVPDFFLRRFGGVDKASFREMKEFAREAAEEKEAAERTCADALKLARARQRKAAYFLSLGKGHKEFKAEAQRIGMTPNEYKDHCKKCVRDYENVFRGYNLSHDSPAEY